ncbi:MAG: cobalamin biosynthesis protein CobQ [Oscillospiraceae bacterium]|jgi:hypothetical protein|nr:cobalamin biosynthesis protein CobQ [Oscillospiraceae bacterium]
MMNLKNIIIVTGHYGSGKTNFSANLALKLAKKSAVSVVDLDIVNPFFRTADFKDLFAGNNISLIASKYANSSLDIPALGFGISGAVKNSGDRTSVGNGTSVSSYTIIDTGGDDEGAKALGRYSDILANRQYEMLYVVNMYRYHTRKPEEALELLCAIETVSGLKCTGIVNNSHLCGETTPEIIAASLPYANEIAGKAGVPLLFTVGKRGINCESVDFPAEVLVKTTWQ